uniref:Uncharacterized protein n=1 Tax=Ditylenchus dipsaci TaxID=166011 RepID=A0A915CZY5_9BILA
MSHGFPPVVITMAKREAYYTALEIGHKGDLRPFIRFIAEATLDTMQDMVSNGLVEVDEAHHKGSVAGSSESGIQKPRWKSEGDSCVLSNRSSLSLCISKAHLTLQTHLQVQVHLFCRKISKTLKCSLIGSRSIALD